jgi:hypothetical protein
MIEILSSPKRLTKFEIVKAKSKIKFYFISHNKENKPNNLYLCKCNSSACNSLSLSLSLSVQSPNKNKSKQFTLRESTAKAGRAQKQVKTIHT